MKLLIVAPSWVGDMTMAQSLFKECRSLDPDAVIDVVAPAWSLPLLNRMPEVRRGIALPVGHGKLGLVVRRRIGRSLVSEAYDRAIIIPRTWKSALIPFFAKIPVRTGFVGELRFGLVNDLRRLDKTRLDQTILRQLALGQDKNAALPPKVRFYPGLKVDPDNQKRLLRDLDLSLDCPLVCFCPGAEYGPAKQWPIPYYRKLAGALIDAGYQVWTLGSPKEKELGRDTRPDRPDGYQNLCGRTRLEDTIDLMDLAEHCVTNDSGLMHVAAATGTRLQAIYGSSSPHYTPPLTRQATIHYLGLACSPCFKRTCPLGHRNCLYEISPEKILESVQSS